MKKRKVKTAGLKSRKKYLSVKACKLHLQTKHSASLISTPEAEILSTQSPASRELSVDRHNAERARILGFLEE